MESETRQRLEEAYKLIDGEASYTSSESYMKAAILVASAFVCEVAKTNRLLKQSITKPSFFE